MLSPYTLCCLPSLLCASVAVRGFDALPGIPSGLLIPTLFFPWRTWWGSVRQAVGPILCSAQGVQQELCVPAPEPGQTPQFWTATEPPAVVVLEAPSMNI